MSHFCFFTDADTTGLLNPQDSSGAFGVVSDTEFRVTSLHTAASDPRVFAVCDGTIAVQQDSQANIVTLILKPKEQPSVKNKINFVPVRYVIYKGVVRDSLIAGSTVADRSKSQLTNRAHETQDAMNRATEVLLEEPANSITLTPSLNLFGYDISGSDNESLDKLFYKPNNSSFQRLSVNAGDYIGDFDRTLFGVEIVLDDVRASANFDLTTHIETKLQSPVASATNASQLFKRRQQKEAAIAFMDPCAFFGSFFQYGGLLNPPVKLRYRLSTDTIVVEDETNDSDLRKAEGKDIYENILVHFANKNAVYVDIRNELNTSLNFYQHYSNTVKIKIPKADDEVINKDYYGNDGWPLLVLRPADFDLHGHNNDSDKDVVKIEIALPNPAGENASPLVYISHGYIDKIKRNKVLRGRKRYVPLTTVDGYTKSFSVAVANISGESKITPVSQYIRIKYLKSALRGVSSGIVPRASHYLDLVFLPFRMSIPFAITANAKSRIFHEDVYLDVEKESGCRFAGSVGIAQDTKNFTLFAYAGDKLKTTGKNELQTISLPSETSTESHYLNLVRDYYRREKLYRGPLILSAGAQRNPSYLRFADGDPRAMKRADYANLSDEFLAVVINATKFVDTRLEHPFSEDYDIFLRFTNEQETATIDGIQYTSCDLMLEGYIDQEPNISLGPLFDLGIKVYSFATDHNLIFVDGEAEYDATTPFDELPFCAGVFDQEELRHLQNFINKMDNAPVPPAPFADLWTKVFRIPGGGEIRVTGGPLRDGPPFELENPNPLALPKGFLAEACTIFTLYKFQQQLVKDTAETTDVDGAGKSTIYKALKEILINSGFKKPITNVATLEFNKMIIPDRHIGARTVSAFLSEEPDPDHPEWPFMYPLKRVMYDLMKVGNLPGHPGEKNFVFVTGPISEDDLLRSIDTILTDYGKKIARLVNEESMCAYKILLPNAKSPDNLFLASGDGTVTSGLFNDSDSAILLFNYGYDGQGGVKKEAVRTFSSRDADLSTIVHLTLFGTNHPPVGADPGDSSVKVSKDGITYVFKANQTNNIIRPVSGTLAGEASYDLAAGLFLYEGRAVAKYDSAQRDLTFIDIGRLFHFDVVLTSHTDSRPPPDDDEIAVSINVVDGPKLHQFEFEAEDLFENDVFALDSAKQSEFEGALLDDSEDVAAIDFAIDRLVHVPNLLISVYLRGNFVGRELRPPQPQTHLKVEKDTGYQFFFTRAEGRVVETFLDSDSYGPLRYSFGRVAITDYHLIITVDSFVSPLWSRLDNKMFQLPLPAAVQVTRKAELDHLTHYYTVAGSDAYVNHVDPRPTDTNHPNLPSYNPILSGLRSFGLAVALKRCLSARALATGYNPSEIHDAMDVRLLDKITQTKIPANNLLGISSDIEYTHFTSFQP